MRHNRPPTSTTYRAVSHQCPTQLVILSFTVAGRDGSDIGSARWFGQSVPPTFLIMPASGTDRLVFVTYLSTPQEEAKDPTTRKLVRSQALRARHGASRLSASHYAQEPELEAAGDQRRYMRRFKFIRQASVARQMAAEGSRSNTQVQHLPVHDGFLDSLGPQTWQLLDYCTSTVLVLSQPPTDMVKTAITFDPSR